MVEITINTDKCAGCSICVVNCPINSKNPETASGKPQEEGAAIMVTDGVVTVINKELCIGCGMCMKACPFGAIVIVK
jgi:4Fe-4S ferredoxin